MTHSIKGKGQLRHRFHGEYSAVIILIWETVQDASDSVKMMGGPWTIHNTEPRATVWQGNSDDLAVCTERLVEYGAEREKIASLAKSIDFGEKFEITIPDVPDSWS